MAGPLGVTHLLLFSKSENGNTNMRIALTPRGPTLSFRVENYSLCKDIAKAQRRPHGMGHSHINPPLLVMNNFRSPDDKLMQESVSKDLESLTTTVFQSLFPPILPQTTPLSSIRRIMLCNREVPSNSEDKDAYIINVRHYAIVTKRKDIPRRLRRLDPTEQRMDKEKALPNLGKLADMADYLLDPSAAGYTSASDTEQDTDAEVEVMEPTAKKVLNKREMQKMGGEERKEPASDTRNVEKRAVKLYEIGPRLKLRLFKVEEGVCGGRVMWHAFVNKSKKEQREMEQTWNKRRKEKDERKKQQKENVEKKRQAKQEKGGNGNEGEAGDEDEDENMEDWDSDMLDEEDEMDYENGGEGEEV